jgi:hypothetical protein
VDKPKILQLVPPAVGLLFDVIDVGVTVGPLHKAAA